MWLSSHLLVSRCRKSSVVEIWEECEQAEMEGPTSLSCRHIQTPACPSPSLVLPQDMQIPLLVLSPPSSPPSFLPSTPALPSASVCFSSARPLSALMPSFLVLLGQSCCHFSNGLTWPGCCCCFSFSLCPLPFTLPRRKKRAPDIAWGEDWQCADCWVSQHLPLPNSTQTTGRVTWTNIPCWVREEQEHHCLSRLLETAVLVHSTLFALAHQPLLPPAPRALICNVVVSN